MCKKNDIINTTNYLFHCDFFADDFDPEDNEEHLFAAYDLLKAHPWTDIYPVWNDYLHSNCKDAEAAINFANLYFYYGGTDEYIPDPYEFVGYLLYLIDLDKYWDVAGDMLDSLFNAVLSKSGKINLMSNPYYQAWKDPNVLAAVERYRNS